MERTIYSKYSNERAREFCIRTDIVEDDAGKKKVYKHALTSEGDAHIDRVAMSYSKLVKAYEGSGISFCPCVEANESLRKHQRACVEFSFLRGKTLHELIEQAVTDSNETYIVQLLQEYIRRMRNFGGEVDFVWTEQFAEVFGVREEAFERETWQCKMISAQVSDIDMIFSNIFVPDTDACAEDALWQIIDYEWTFDFPIPKDFLIYRALYFAYYQILYRYNWSLQELFAMADITDEQARLFQQMEEHFQGYMGKGVIPVRNMQRAMGTQVVSLAELLAEGSVKQAGGAVGIAESEWMKVRKLRYHVDRCEYQDGAMICSGWAVANTWDGRTLPVNIKVLSESGEQLPAEITRRDRSDVATALKLRRVTNAAWGFDCVWIIAEKQKCNIHFSLGNKECICPVQ